MRFFLVFPLLVAACSVEALPERVSVSSAPLAVFPADRYTVADANTRTGLRVRLPDGAADDAVLAKFPDLKTELESLDGFGTSAPLWIRFDGPIDPASLPDLAGSTAADAAVQLVRVDTGERIAFETHYDGPTHTLFILPYGALAPKTRHTLVVTEALHDRFGRPIAAASAHRDTSIDGVAGAVVSVGFTTQSVTETLAALALRDVAHDAAEYPATLTACTSSLHIGWVGKGMLHSPDYGTEENRFPLALDDAEPAPAPREDMRIPYIIVLPKGVERAPTVLVQHGLSGDKEGVLLCNMGEQYAAHGFATVAIDGAWHGERGPGGKKPSPLSYLRVLFGVWTDGQTMNAKLRFGRDAFRQTALDHVQLAALVKAMAPALDRADGGDGKPDLSGDVFYNGESMGGIIGSLTTAVAPNMPASVLNVPGGRLSNLVLLSEIHLYELVAEPVVSAVAELGEGDVRRFLALFQTMAERGDPINYAPLWHLTPADGRPKKSVIIQETTDDVLVPNRTTEDLARAGGLKRLTPALADTPHLGSEAIPSGGLSGNLGDGLTGGMVQLKTVTRGGEQEEASHGTMGTPEALDQAAEFFRTWLGGEPTVFRAY